MKKLSKINGFILIIVFAILMYLVYRLNIIPIKYFALLVFGIFIVIGIISFKLFRKKTKFISCIFFNIISIILIVLAIYIMTYINATYKFINNLVADNFETITYDVITNVNSSYNHIGDLYEKEVGSLNSDKNYSLARIKIRKDVSYKDKKYDSVEELTAAITTGDVSSIVLEDSYYEMLKEEYTDLSSTTRIIKQYKIIVKKENAKKQTVKQTSKDSFIVYISGIDTYGNISSVSRSDVNILAVVNKKTSQILLVSIPRDYYVDLYNKSSKDKLTHAGIYGIDTSINTINNLLDTKIDYFVRLNFSTLTKSIDLIDGIDVYSDKDLQLGKIKINQGMNHMDGEKALAFARERKSYATGDRHRGENQQAIITAMIKKMTSKEYIIKYKDILTSLEGTFETSMTYEEITDLFKMQLNDNIKWNITSISLDGTGSMQETYSMGSRKLYVMIPDQTSIDESKQKIKEIQNGK